MLEYYSYEIPPTYQEAYEIIKSRYLMNIEHYHNQEKFKDIHILVKNNFKAHRSHAYQNLARLTGSHLKITCWVTLYHVMWLLPLSIWSVLVPEIELVAVFLAIIPGLTIAYKYGPVLSST